MDKSSLILLKRSNITEKHVPFVHMWCNSTDNYGLCHELFANKKAIRMQNGGSFGYKVGRKAERVEERQEIVKEGATPYGFR